MTVAKLVELEQRLEAMQRQLDGTGVELARVQSEIRIVEQRHRRFAPLERLFVVAGLSVAAMVLTSALSPEIRAANPSGTVLNAPVYIQDESKRFIAEIGNRAQHQGITVYNEAGGEVAFIGVSKSNHGVIGLSAPDGQEVATMGPFGFSLNEGGKTIAFLGRKSTDPTHGYFELGDSTGQVLVKARVNASGLGIVEVGPGGWGVAAALTGGKAASALLGKKG